MKKVLVLLSLAVMFTFAAQSQVSVGVKGGLTIANMSFENNEFGTFDAALGGHAAIFLRTGKGLFSFQPEVMWIQKGSRFNLKSDATYTQLTMNYIDVPLLLRATIGIKIVEVYFNLGPYAGYWISGASKDYFYDDSQSKWVTEKDSYDFDDDYDVRFDAGLVGGVGVKVLMIIFEMRYGQGFIDVFDNEDNNNEWHSYFNFTLGVQL